MLDRVRGAITSDATRLPLPQRSPMKKKKKKSKTKKNRKSRRRLLLTREPSMALVGPTLIQNAISYERSHHWHLPLASPVTYFF